MKSPAHKYDSIKKLQSVPKNAHDALLYTLMQTGKCENEAVAAAWDIFQHEYKREVLEACILSDMTAAEISSLLKLSPAIVKEYTYFFFDPEVFTSNLDKTDYAYTYRNSKFGSELKKMAVDLGKECLKIRLGGPDQQLSTNYVVNSVRATACLLSNMVRTNKVNAAIANMALRWATVALKAVDTKQEADPNAAIEALKLQLEETPLENDKKIENSEIIH